MIDRRTAARLAALLFSASLLLCSPLTAAADSGWSPSAAASGLSDALPLVENIDGLIRVRNYLDARKDNDEEEFYEFRNDLRLGADLHFFEWMSGRISAQQYLHYGLNDENYHPEQTNFRLWEGYIDLLGGKSDLRIGRQVIRWGKGDEVNPVDDFTPEDFREFINLDRAERKLPVLAANLRYHLSDSLRWQGIWLPFFEQNRFAGTDQDWEFFFRRFYRGLFDLRDIPEDRPANSLENSGYATRVTYQGAAGDFSLSYSYHRDQNLSYEVTLDPSRVDPELGPVVAVWDRLHSVGADFESVYAGFGIRGEVAFTIDKPSVTRDQSDDDLLKRKDTFNTLLGADYTFDNGLYINLQLLQDYILRRDSLMFYQAYEGSVTARMRKRFFRELFKLEATGRTFYTRRDFFLHVGGSYELAEGLDLEAEYHLFEGEEDRIFGQFDDNDQFYLGARYYF